MNARHQLGLSFQNRLTALAAALLATTLAVACGDDLQPPPPPMEPIVCRPVDFPDGAGAKNNVVLIIADAMRRDRAGIYGGPSSTPSFDRFASEHLLFRRASSQAPWTKPSIATLFTSLFPSQHRVASDPELQGAFGVHRTTELIGADVLSSEFVTLAELLRGTGRRTGAVVPNPWLQATYGFDQGFDFFDDSLAAWEAGGADVSRAAIDWLDAIDAEAPFFLYVHYMDPHRPYGALSQSEANAAAAAADPDDSRELDEKGERFFRNFMKTSGGESLFGAGVDPSAVVLELAYNRGVEDFDRALGTLLDALRAHPSWERTAVIVTADHGEALYAHGYGNHGGGLFEDETAIPLALRLPGAHPEQGVVDCLTGLVDLLPTLCDYAAMDCPANLAGTSLRRAQPGEGPSYTITEGVMTRPDNRAANDGRWKLVYEPMGRRDGRTDVGPWSLFAVGRDPAEMNDLFADRSSPEIGRAVERLKQVLANSIPDFEGPAPLRRPIDSETAERLRALGYDSP